MIDFSSTAGPDLNGRIRGVKYLPDHIARAYNLRLATVTVTEPTEDGDVDYRLVSKRGRIVEGTLRLTKARACR